MTAAGGFTNDRRARGILIAAGAALAVPLLALFLLLAFGWGLLRGTVERRLAAATGHAVRIGSIARVGPISFSPLLELRGVRVAQPAWAGRGDMLRIDAARLRLPLIPLLAGRVVPEAIAMQGVRLALVRDAAGRANWAREPAAPGGGMPDFGDVTLHDGAISLDDAVRDRHFRAGVTIDAAGLRAAGTGGIAGHPATIRLTGPSVAGARAWPFDLRIGSAIVSAHLAGRAARPLDFGHFTGRMEASGRDLRDLDRLIEVGLFATQPFRLAATIGHDRPSWTISDIGGTIGRSDVGGAVSIRRRGDRMRIDGDIASNGFDFDDLSTDASLARAAADLRRRGPRLIPPAPIDLSRLRKLDGTLRFTLRRLLFATPSSVKSLRGTATLDHGVLTVAPLLAGLERGRVTGTAIVRHQAGRPRLTLDLALADARLEGLVTDKFTARGALAGRLRLRGYGMTVREAVGRSSGTIGVAVRDGKINRRAALAIGTDLSRALFADRAESAPLRCLVAHYGVRAGVARPDLLLLDTAVARGIGSGEVRLDDERIALEMRGMPKLKGGLHFDGAIRIDGTIKRPRVTPPPGVVTAHGILKAIAKTLGGDRMPLAGDADCAGLAARALR